MQLRIQQQQAQESGVEQQTDASNIARFQQQQEAAGTFRGRDQGADAMAMTKRLYHLPQQPVQDEEKLVSLFGAPPVPRRAPAAGPARGRGGYGGRGRFGDGLVGRGGYTENWGAYGGESPGRRTAEIGGRETVRALDWHGHGHAALYMGEGEVKTDEHVRRTPRASGAMDVDTERVDTEERVRRTPRTRDAMDVDTKRERLGTDEYVRRDRAPTTPSHGSAARFGSGSASPTTPFEEFYQAEESIFVTPTHSRSPRDQALFNGVGQPTQRTLAARHPTAIELAGRYLPPLPPGMTMAQIAAGQTRPPPPTLDELASQALDGRPPLKPAQQPPTSAVPSLQQPTTASQAKQRQSAMSSPAPQGVILTADDVRRKFFGGELPENKRGRPEGKKDAVKRQGHPNPNKGKSKYGDVPAPSPDYTGSADQYRTTSSEIQKQRIWKGHLMAGNDGAPAATRCDECRRRKLDCRFFKDAKKSGTCNHCEVNHRTCRGGVRVRNDDPEDHTSSKMPPLRRRDGDGDDDRSGGRGGGGYGGGNMAGVVRRE
ncbi:hypothetical protein LTR17_013945 [Elasticomyces elasticus]|nr:hypothetical protein LTR17_013945 [Elasticomyces elasticus]